MTAAVYFLFTFGAFDIALLIAACVIGCSDRLSDRVDRWLAGR